MPLGARRLWVHDLPSAHGKIQWREWHQAVSQLTCGVQVARPKPGGAGGMVWVDVPRKRVYDFVPPVLMPPALMSGCPADSDVSLHGLKAFHKWRRRLPHLYRDAPSGAHAVIAAQTLREWQASSPHRHRHSRSTHRRESSKLPTTISDEGPPHPLNSTVFRVATVVSHLKCRRDAQNRDPCAARDEIAHIAYFNLATLWNWLPYNLPPASSGTTATPGLYFVTFPASIWRAAGHNNPPPVYVGMYFNQPLLERVRQHITAILSVRRAYPNMPSCSEPEPPHDASCLPLYTLARQLQCIPLFYSICVCRPGTTKLTVLKLESFFINQLRSGSSYFDVKTSVRVHHLKFFERGLNIAAPPHHKISTRPMHRKLKAILQQPVPRSADDLIPTVCEIITDRAHGFSCMPYTKRFSHTHTFSTSSVTPPVQSRRLRLFCAGGAPNTALLATLHNLAPPQLAALRACILRNHVSKFRTSTVTVTQRALLKLNHFISTELKSKQFQLKSQLKPVRGVRAKPSLIFRIDLVSPRLSHITTRTT